MKSINSDDLFSFRASDIREWTHQTHPSIKEQHGDINTIKLLSNPFVLNELGHLSKVSNYTFGVNLFPTGRLDISELLINLLLVSSDYAYVKSKFSKVLAYLFSDAIRAT